MIIERDVMEYDVLIVGGGPAGLSAAIKIKQLAAKENKEISVCLVEKGAEVGSHILSGAVIDPVALTELIPSWKEKGAPLNTKVSKDIFNIFSEKKNLNIPHWLMPPIMSNKENYIVSLGDLCIWLSKEAESIGVEIYPGFSAQMPIFNSNKELIGISTGDMGRDSSNNETSNYAAGIEIHAKYSLIAEGTRGSITKIIEKKLNLRKNSDPQKYGLGFKEVWRLDKNKHQPGLVEHSLGWPLKNDTGGGSFTYHYGENLVSLGFVVHLDYSNAYISPFDEFQRFKTHPKIKNLLTGAERVSYGARAINEGGIQSWPELAFPGGAFIGCSAGMVNVPRIKGTHNAMKSGMLGAEACVDAIFKPENIKNQTLDQYIKKMKDSWVWDDLNSVRNIKPLISKYGTIIGMLFGGIEMWLASYKINLPWTLHHKKADHEMLMEIKRSKPINYLKPDGIYTFDKLSSISLSNIGHESNQPCHLKLIDKDIAININYKIYNSPEQRYCPAGVYEVLQEDKGLRLQINSQNCIHCKACDIKDPGQNINWVPPEGGSGPIYSKM
jgi:electron-transferring-flavoprotein dehydrogenase